jgi:Animal haem peroxidase
MSRAHGGELRGLPSVSQLDAPFGRFGRLFRPPAQYGDDFDKSKEVLAALAETMIAREFDEKDQKGEKRDPTICEQEPEDENSTIPAGYTYLGQFIDHDITFDPVSSLQAENDPNALEDFRTPRLDLDSVYGRGLADQPYLYNQDKPGEFLLGADRKAAGSAPRLDVPRNSQNVALIADPRNDENLIVVQLHALFLRFHNAIFNTLTHRSQPMPDRFAVAQRLVRWHYQWIVLHDFLPLIVGEAMALKVLNPGGQPNLQYYHVKPAVYPFMPVEFSVAAYRFGHSMVRPTYALNQDVVGPAEGLDQKRFTRVPLFTADNPSLFPRANLNGFRPIPQGWGIDWSFFFKGLPTPSPKAVRHPCTADKSPVLPQPSYRIDTELVDPLGMLPDPPPVGVPKNSLALRNLIRGLAVGLPNGQRVAQALGEHPISDDDLWDGKERQEVLKHFPQFANNAPLWFYILMEAELTNEMKDPNGGGHHLGPAGGRLVAEVLVGLAYYDQHSFLRQTLQWRPHPEVAREDGTFDMARLIEFTDQRSS